MSLFSPNRLSTPTIRKFSSPNCALGSTMSREPRSSAETLLSMLFFDDCHCQAPPVSASADTAIRAAAARPADHRLTAPAPAWLGLRRCYAGADARRLHPVAPAQRRQIRHFGGIPGDDGDNLGVRIFRVGAHRRDDLGGRCRAAAGPRLGFGAGPPQFLGNTRSAVHLGDQVGDRHTVGVVTGLRGLLDVPGVGIAAALPRRGAWRWPRTSGKPLIVAASVRRPRRPGRPGVALSPSLMFLPASDSLTIVRVGAHGRMQCLCLPLVRVAAFCGLRHWSRIRQDSYRTETT